VIPVVVPVYDRTHYVTQTLASWRDVRGIGDTPVIHSCEPGQPAMVDLIRQQRPPSPGAVLVNPEQLGNDQNMKAALTAGFATGADFVIAAEDDVIVSTDLLEYMAWARDTYAADKSVLAVTAFRFEEPGPLDAVLRTPWFFGGACWGMWRDRWDEMEPGWPPSWYGYDLYLWTLAKETGRVCIQPAATRCRNIGEHGTNTHGEASGFADVWERQQFVAEVPPQSYREA